VRLGTVDKHIESLRKKLGPYGSMIRTVYGLGYALRESP
jgi:DNA-binding response OmpR family regulator